MKSILKLFSLLLITALSSCEDVIEIDLKNVEQRFVIEAFMQANTGVCEVKISKTRNFNEDNEFEAEKEATVLLVLPNGEPVILLTEEHPGQYLAQNVEIVPGATYQLQIITQEGQEFSASTNAPYFVGIDTLVVEEHPFPDPDNENDTFMVVCEFNDPAGQANNYRLKATINGQIDPYLYILRDDEILVDNEIRLPVFREEVFSGDSVTIELISMDRASFNYFERISDISQQNGGGSIIPFNPQGNFDNGALGYFGIFNSDFRTLLIN